ncbi:MAG: hypothetical protein IH940_02565, partial [Acidobacteria bacterium]|nr:hypothetical protein [Acidobacteriota bacterium]
MSNRAEITRMRSNLWRIAAEASELLGSESRGEDRPRVVVVCWDLTHNPVGRAYVLYQLLERDYDVDLVGPMWSRFGDVLWSPLAAEPISLASFGASNVIDYLPRAVAMLGRNLYDYVICVKPRLPGLYLSILLAEWSNVPLVLDIDDDESAFADPPIDDYDNPDGRDPISQMLDVEAAALSERSISIADSITVVSRPLQDRYGGIMVRHARRSAPLADSDDAAMVRAENRATYDIANDERAIFFVGTVRAHKGVAEIVE